MLEWIKEGYLLLLVFNWLSPDMSSILKFIILAYEFIHLDLHHSDKHTLMEQGDLAWPSLRYGRWSKFESGVEIL